jgi:IS4 transposase
VRANRKQTQMDPRSAIAAEYLILATSLAESEFPDTEILAVYRLHWQIELAFKKLKPLLHMDKIRTRNRGRNTMLALCPSACRTARGRFQPGYVV